MAEEVADINLVFGGQIARQERGLLCETEQLLFVVDVGDALAPDAVVEGDVGQIGDVAVKCHRESDLHILTAVVLVAEQVGVVVVGLPEDVCPIERRAEVEHAHVLLGDDGLEQLTARCDGGMVNLTAGGGLVRGLVVELPVGDDHRHFGMGFHHADFFLELLRIGPEIVACAVGDIASAALEQAVEVIVVDAFVVFVTEQADDVGVFLGIRLADGPCAVGGAVFANHDLEGHVALLHEDRVDGATDGVLLVVGDDDDGYEVLH